MNKEIILVKNNSRGKPQYQKILLDDEVVIKEWGLIGGKIQQTSNEYKVINAGKANELSPQEAALAGFTRIVKKKLKEGYLETQSLTDLPDLNKEINIDLDNIPESFCISKPTQKVSVITLDKLIASGNAKFFIKYNGLCHYILIKTNGKIKLFTRRWYDHTRKYPEIVKAVQEAKFPTGTLLLAEFCIDPSLKIPHMTAFKLMSSISKSDTNAGICKPELPKTIARLKKHKVKAAIISILYSKELKTWDYPHNVVLHSLQHSVPSLADGKAIFVPTEVPITSGTQAFEIVRSNKDKIEGFVVWDMTEHMTVTLNGKPDRCAAWKVKATGEKDVVAWGWEEGNGRNQGKIGSIKICQYDAEGNQIDLGTIDGLKEKEGQREPDNWQFPCVVEVGYDQIFPDTGKFQFGHLNKIHEDKIPAEVDIFTL
jgi:hypothetical protein